MKIFSIACVPALLWAGTMQSMFTRTFIGLCAAQARHFDYKVSLLTERGVERMTTDQRVEEYLQQMEKHLRGQINYRTFRTNAMLLAHKGLTNYYKPADTHPLTQRPEIFEIPTKCDDLGLVQRLYINGIFPMVSSAGKPSAIYYASTAQMAKLHFMYYYYRFGIPLHRLDTGETVLHWVARYGYEDSLVGLYVSLGVKPTWCDRRDNTALHVLAKDNSLKDRVLSLAQKLVYYGVPPNARNRSDKDAADYLAEREQNKPDLKPVIDQLRSILAKGENFISSYAQSKY